MHRRFARFTDYLRVGGLLAVTLCFSVAVSYGAVRAWRGGSARASQPAASTWFGSEDEKAPRFATGRHLVVYVMVASGCGFSTEKRTIAALRQVPDSIRGSHGQDFVDISIVGIVLDDDIDTALRYVQDVERSRTVFDQLSLGGSWLNEEVVRFVWRDGVATAQLPQILLVERQVDAENYPRNIVVRQDSLFLTITGRDELITWVASGTPLATHPRR